MLSFFGFCTVSFPSVDLAFVFGLLSFTSVDPAYLVRTSTFSCGLDSVVTIQHLRYHRQMSYTMVPCTICSSSINEDDQYYILGNMGPDIISLIENNLGHEVDDSGYMCGNCFANIMETISASDTMTNRMVMSSVQEEYELQHAHDINVCVWCQSSLHMRRAHALPEGPERHLISERISPRNIPDGSLVCYRCWVWARNILQQQEVEALPEESASSAIISNSCVWCLCSLNQRRRHSIPEGPERNEIVRRIFPREIPLGGLVCYACWVSARRNVQRGANIVEQHEDPVSAHHHRNVICAICGMSLFRRRTFEATWVISGRSI